MCGVQTASNVGSQPLQTKQIRRVYVYTKTALRSSDNPALSIRGKKRLGVRN